MARGGTHRGVLLRRRWRRVLLRHGGRHVGPRIRAVQRVQRLGDGAPRTAVRQLRGVLGRWRGVRVARLHRGELVAAERRGRLALRREEGEGLKSASFLEATTAEWENRGASSVEEGTHFAIAVSRCGRLRAVLCVRRQRRQLGPAARAATRGRNARRAEKGVLLVVFRVALLRGARWGALQARGHARGRARGADPAVPFGGAGRRRADVVPRHPPDGMQDGGHAGRVASERG